MKKIWPWLLLLLLLIIFCVWSKKDSMQVTSTVPTQVTATQAIATQKHYINYTIAQKEDAYTLHGNFANTQQYASLADTYTANSNTLTLSDTSLNDELLGEEAITLTNKILPHFIKNYKNGKIVYDNNTLRVSGDVANYEAQRQMQALLNTSTLASQNNTNVVMKKPIHFSITKTLDTVDFSGTFNSSAQGDALRSKLPATTNTNITQAAHLVDGGVISLTESILPSFMSSYKHGKIEYNNEVLTISGMVATEEDLEAIKTLLSHSTLAVTNNTTIDQEALAKVAADAEAALQEKEAQLAADAKSAKLAEEAKQTADAEAKRLAEKEAKLEETQQMAAAVKEKITKLLQIENIEFRSAKGSLTKKGMATVDKLANILLQYPNIKAEIAGHTDSDGSAIFNQKLSQARVDTAKARLVKKGIDATRLTARGYGESKPLVPNTNKANKQKNRRVEIHIQGE